MISRVITTFIILILVSSFVSCINCEALADSYRKDECILIVEKIPTIYENYFNYEGREPSTEKKCKCKGEYSYRWWNTYKDKIEIGDTIIKKRGELIFNIHKKDTVLSFNWECEDKNYK